MAKKVTDLDDPNEFELASRIARTLEDPVGSVYISELAVRIIEVVKSEGWVPPEERDRAVHDKEVAEHELVELHQQVQEGEDEIIKLRTQVAKLIDQMAYPAYTPPGYGTTGTGTGISVSPPYGGYTFTSTSTANSALPAEIAEYVRKRKPNIA